MQNRPAVGCRIPAMPVINTVKPQTFYVAFNIIFDLETGATKRVLLLVNKVEDATVFGEQESQNYFNFVSMRAPNMQWTVEALMPSPLLPSVLFKEHSPQRYVIKGVQYV
jgi:hypothetical protein